LRELRVGGTPMRKTARFRYAAVCRHGTTDDACRQDARYAKHGERRRRGNGSARHSQLSWLFSTG
jgi:hypothetical protein